MKEPSDLTILRNLRKVWMNFQVEASLKKRFDEYCRARRINKSKLFREYMLKVIKEDTSDKFSTGD